MFIRGLSSGQGRTHSRRISGGCSEGGCRPRSDSSLTLFVNPRLRPAARRLACPLLVLGSLPGRELSEGRPWVASVSRFARLGWSLAHACGLGWLKGGGAQRASGRKPVVLLSLGKAVRGGTATCYPKEAASPPLLLPFSDRPSAVRAAAFCLPVSPCRSAGRYGDRRGGSCRLVLFLTSDSVPCWQVHSRCPCLLGPRLSLLCTPSP